MTDEKGLAKSDYLDRGLENRYHVAKIDDPIGKHEHCRYFVLDPAHDMGARFALRAYKVWAAKQGYNALAEDLDEWLDRLTKTDQLCLKCVAKWGSMPSAWGDSIEELDAYREHEREHLHE